MTTNLGNVEEQLLNKFGHKGVDYLTPQLEIIRSARNMPSKLDDFRLMTQKMHESWKMISQWLAPVIVPITEELSELEIQLRELQYQIKFQIQQEGITYWKNV
ncbi:MAG: hypothetical protein ACFE9L_08910 [Candidatus Hodarchaeota archaeon]